MTGQAPPRVSPKVIDCLVNVHFGETAKQPEFMLKVRDDYFKGPQSLYEQVELPALLDEMDENGVTKAILMDNLVKPSVTARNFRLRRRVDRPVFTGNDDWAFSGAVEIGIEPGDE